MRRPRLALLMGALLVFLGGVGPLTAAPKLKPKEKEERGRTLFLGLNCHECHAVSSAGIKVQKRKKRATGTDLSQLPRKKLQMKPAALRWHRQQVYKRVKKAPASKFKGTDEELQALVDWLLEQKAEG